MAEASKAPVLDKPMLMDIEMRNTDVISILIKSMCTSFAAQWATLNHNVLKQPSI